MAPGSREKPRITRWMRLRRFIYNLESPLRLRGTLTRLRHRHKHPYLALLRLLLPLPTWHFQLPECVPHKVMLNNVSLLQSRKATADLTNMRSVPLWRARDTPLRSLYRIYEAMAAREFYAIGAEVEYFWYQSRGSWAAHHIPDPHDRDPVRYAILACIAEELARSFNWRMRIGMRRDKSKHIFRKTFDDPLPPFTPETPPGWTRKVPAIDIQLISDLPPELLDGSGRLVLEPGGENPIFAERNIVTDTGHFYTV
ncbi:hypothetical protein N7462_004358 [Penicillium macrosclerotiorum]|uniref:uncharacterized protein n=1 Tax=Penicillium macrosclerotiorum TaxID=303699 RepID=UPI002548C2B7|nr:uncharacterized protein N7462_004358 [Penicillium macrosclerotiorum]KAJ5689966.1 hypothetical protein N7462_004358 [Penicillium macrosclerotiorum]